MTIRRLITTRRMAWLLTAIIAATLGILAAIRPDGIGTDTANYRSRFLRMVADGSYSSRYEPAFDLVMKVAAYTGSAQFFFGLIYATLLLSMLMAMNNAISRTQRDRLAMFPLAALGLLLSSSWFITGSVNGMRQGLSLGALYLGITLILYRKQWLLGLVLIGISPLFHQSAILLWPAIPLVGLLSVQQTFVFFLLGAAAYTIGISESAILVFSQLTNINAHEWIINYAPGVRYASGWQFNLFIYTVGMAILHMIGRHFVDLGRRRELDVALKTYMVLCIPYFILGFGNFSNRFGIMAWAFLPILHVVWLFNTRIDRSLRTYISLTLCLVGVLKYSAFLAGSL